MSKEMIRIANCSGFYGDKLSVAKDMVEGGPIDVLTGDYLAELTMTILYNQKMKRGENHGYVGTFIKQFKDVAKIAQDKNIKIVTNAGGLNPKSMALEIENVIEELNLNLKVAYIDGDDLIPMMDKLTDLGEKFLNLDKDLELKDYSKKPIQAFKNETKSARCAASGRSSYRHKRGICNDQRRVVVRAIYKFRREKD